MELANCLRVGEQDDCMVVEDAVDTDRLGWPPERYGEFAVHPYVGSGIVLPLALLCLHPNN